MAIFGAIFLLAMGSLVLHLYNIVGCWDLVTVPQASCLQFVSLLVCLSVAFHCHQNLQALGVFVFGRDLERNGWGW